MGKRRKQKNRLPVPLISLGIVGLLLILASIFFFTQNTKGDGRPVLIVDQNKIDFGEVKFNTPKSFAIKVTNIGDGDLRFKEKPYIQIMEGC